MKSFCFCLLLKYLDFWCDTSVDIIFFVITHCYPLFIILTHFQFLKILSFFSEIKENKTLIKHNQTVIINMTLFLFLKVFPPPSCRFIVKMCSNLQEKSLFSRNQCYVCLIQSLIFHSWQFWHSVNNDLPVVKGLTGLHETDPRKARVNNWLMSK